MKRIVIITILVAIITGCEKKSIQVWDPEGSYLCRVVGYDQNCSNCIIEFPDDSSIIKQVIGPSAANKYSALNLFSPDYKSGEMLLVKIRKAGNYEVPACKSMYATGQFENIVITDSKKFDLLLPGKETLLKKGECLFESENQFYLCLDEVVNDSRCPEGAYCFWAGNAMVRFRFQKLNSDPVYFILQTYRETESEIVIGNIKIRMTDIKPYPTIKEGDNDPENTGEQRAMVIVTEI